MKIFNINITLTRNLKIKNNFIVSHFEQILDAFMIVSKRDSIEEYEIILIEIKKYLNHKELELFVRTIQDLSNSQKLINLIEDEKYFWSNQIKNQVLDEIYNSKFSLCTSDFLAFIIGRKYVLSKLIKEKSMWSETYINLQFDLNRIIIENNLLCSLEVGQKAHVPVNYALSMFLLYDKEIALKRFKSILRDDRNHRLEVLHQAEYFLIVENFFNRIKLNFIPQINYSNFLNPVEFENVDNKYITRDKIQLIIDKEDYFNKRNFDVELKKLLKEKNILNKELLRYSYLNFFKAIDNDKMIEEEHINILISCFTQKNQDYDEYKIRNTRFILTNLLNEGKNSSNFIILNYYLDTNKVFKDAKNNLAFLLCEFFNKVKGMSNDTIKNIFYGRKAIDFDSSFPIELKEYIKNNSM